MILILTREQMTTLQKEAIRTYPIEACALIFGRVDTRQAVAERVIVTRNVLQSPTRFEVDIGAFYDALTQADKDGLEFVGFFHSHSCSINPSEVDVRFMRLWENAVWVIFSSADDAFRAFQMRNGKVHNVVLKIREKI